MGSDARTNRQARASHKRAIAGVPCPDVRWTGSNGGVYNPNQQATDVSCMYRHRDRKDLFGAHAMKILIVDDHPLFRAGFHTVLEQGALDAGILSVSSVPEAMQILQRDSDVGLVLLDIHLRGGQDGFYALKVIGEKYPTTACIIISGDEGDGIASRAVAAGASGFIPKSFTADEMVAAIQQVLAGEVFLPAREETSTNAQENGSLTLRQLEVIQMLGRGCSNKEIARALDVAERTVKAHVSAVFEALNVRNRTQAVLAAQRRGFLTASNTAYAATR